LAVYDELHYQTGNLVFSPHGLWTAMALLYPGTGGGTRERLGQFLDIESVDNAISLGRELKTRTGVPSGYRNLHKEPQSSDLTPSSEVKKSPSKRSAKAIRVVPTGRTSYDFSTRLDVANAMWFQRGYPVKGSYLRAVKEAFETKPEPIDLADREGTASLVNKWVREATNGRVDRVIEPASIDPKMRAILANAVYFKSRWLNTFHEEETKPEPFHVSAESTVLAPMMRQHCVAPLARDGDLLAVELPYVCEDLVMDVLLPDAILATGAPPIATPQRVSRLLSTLKETSIDLRMPRFCVKCRAPLLEPLAKVGLGDLFSSGLPDFSGVSDEPGFAIGDIVQSTLVDVSELGTEAASGSAIYYAGGRSSSTVEVVMDRPFYFVIRDKPTDTFLFFGRILDPP